MNTEHRICKFKQVVQTYPDSLYWNVQYLDEITDFKKRPAQIVVSVKRYLKLKIKCDLILPGAILKLQIRHSGSTKPQILEAEEIKLDDAMNMGLLRHVLTHFENITYSTIMKFIETFPEDAFKKYIQIDSSLHPSLIHARKQASQFYKNHISKDDVHLEDTPPPSIETQFMLHLFALHYFLPNFSILNLQHDWSYFELDRIMKKLFKSQSQFFSDLIPKYQLFEEDDPEHENNTKAITRSQLYKIIWKDRHSLVSAIDEFFHEPGATCQLSDRTQCIFMHSFLILHDAERDEVKHSCMPLSTFFTQLKTKLTLCRCFLDHEKFRSIKRPETIKIQDLVTIIHAIPEITIFTTSDQKQWVALSKTHKDEINTLDLFRNSERMPDNEKVTSPGTNEDKQNKEYKPTEEQRDAISLIRRYKRVCLQGLAGSGKTTVVLRQVVQDAERRGVNVTLLAPTGAAADRMTEAISGHGTSLSASTIHRKLMQQTVLKNKKKTGQKRKLSVMDDHVKNENIDQDWKMSGLLIVDEATMVSTELFTALWKFVDTDNCQIVLVGDHCQLPSIAHGNLFSNLVHHKDVTVAKLTRVLRQSEDSAILAYAAWFRQSIEKKIVTGRPPCPQNDEMQAFLLAKKDQLPHYVLNQIKKYPERNYHLISPLKNDPTWGCHGLNQFLQKQLNPKESYDMERRLEKMRMKSFRCKMAIGDPVVFRVNRPEFNLSNGSIGKVRDCVIKQKSILHEIGKTIWEASDFHRIPNAAAGEEKAVEFSVYETMDGIRKWMPMTWTIPPDLHQVKNVPSQWKRIDDNEVGIKEATSFDVDLKNGEPSMNYNDKMIILLVEFDQRNESIWRWIEISEDRLELAYICTVHVSQGATYEHLIVLVPPVNDQRSHFYTTQLMYTAFTRASKSLVLFYDTQGVLQQYAKNIFKRNTVLSIR